MLSNTDANAIAQTQVTDGVERQEYCVLTEPANAPAAQSADMSTAAVSRGANVNLFGACVLSACGSAIVTAAITLSFVAASRKHVKRKAQQRLELKKLEQTAKQNERAKLAWRRASEENARELRELWHDMRSLVKDLAREREHASRRATRLRAHSAPSTEQTSSGNNDDTAPTTARWLSPAQTPEPDSA